MTRTVKIPRLPQAVREELSRRLHEAEPGGPLPTKAAAPARPWSPLRKRACAPPWAMMLLAPLAEAYGNGEAGCQAAVQIHELQHGRERGTERENPDMVRPGQTQSNPVKTGQT